MTLDGNIRTTLIPIRIPSGPCIHAQSGPRFCKVRYQKGYLVVVVVVVVVVAVLTLTHRRNTM